MTSGKQSRNNVNHTKTVERLLTLRISEDNFEELNHRAKKVGMSRSAYCRDLLLNAKHEAKWPKHEFASALCKHHVMVDQYITDADLKQMFYDWEVVLWQLLR